MRQRQVPGQIAPEVAHSLAHWPGAEDQALGIASDKQGQLDMRHERKQPGMPEGGAFPSRRGVSAVREPSGIAESDRDYGDPADVVKSIARNLQPVAQPVAG